MYSIVRLSLTKLHYLVALKLLWPDAVQWIYRWQYLTKWRSVPLTCQIFLVENQICPGFVLYENYLNLSVTCEKQHAIFNYLKRWFFHWEATLTRYYAMDVDLHVRNRWQSFSPSDTLNICLQNLLFRSRTIKIMHYYSVCLIIFMNDLAKHALSIDSADHYHGKCEWIHNCTPFRH